MAHMVQQIIKFSDGTETVIDYRGKIVNGVLIPNGEVMDEVVEEVKEEVAAPEVVEEVVAEEAAPEVAAEEVAE